MENEALTILESAQAVLKGHFKLTSGLHSEMYVQCAQVFQYPDKTEKLCRLLSEKLHSRQVDTVIGPAVGGIIFAYELARVLKCKTIYAEREDGVMKLRRNFSLAAGERVYVVEDVVTTGGSVREVAELAKTLGANILGVCSLVDRSNGKVGFNVPFIPLITLDVKTFDPTDCPLCKDGKPITQPGSRHLKL